MNDYIYKSGKEKAFVSMSICKQHKMHVYMHMSMYVCAPQIIQY